MKNIASKGYAETEHILVCLSASPTNAKIVNTAAKMASAFGGSFTALYVQTPDSDKMDDASKRRLQYHIHLAEKLGANITTVYGEDVSFQIAEYARISGVTKIVIGRSNVKRRHFWSKPTLTEKLTEIVPNIDIHIIPDSTADQNTRKRPTDSGKRSSRIQRICLSPCWCLFSPHCWVSRCIISALPIPISFRYIFLACF